MLERLLVFTFLSLTLALAQTPGGQASQPHTQQTCPEASGQPLRVGVLPVLNASPLFAALREGFYQEAGVLVELVPIESPRDRSIGLQTGTLDVGNNDVIAAVLQIASGDDLKIVRHDSFEPGVRFFSIVTGAQTGLDTPEKLVQALREDRAQIAISNNTLIHYLATRLLRDAGYEPEPDDYLEVNAIPVRLEQVAQGTVAAALLPEPLTTLATEVQGGFNVLDDSSLEFVPVALTVRGAVLAERPGDVCRFLAAYDRAAAAITADPEAYRDSGVRIPEAVAQSYRVPSFVAPRVPTPEELAEVQDWMVSAGLLDAALPYEAVVDGRFVPGAQP